MNSLSLLLFGDDNEKYPVRIKRVPEDPASGLFLPELNLSMKIGESYTIEKEGVCEDFSPPEYELVLDSQSDGIQVEEHTNDYTITLVRPESDNYVGFGVTALWG